MAKIIYVITTKNNCKYENSEGIQRKIIKFANDKKNKNLKFLFWYNFLEFFFIKYKM